MIKFTFVDFFCDFSLVKTEILESTDRQVYEND